MGLWQFWQQRREKRIERYLHANAGTALNILRMDESLASQAIERFFLDAAAGAPNRESFQYPILSQLGFGGRTPLQRSLPKLAPWTIRNFSERPPARRAINCLKNPILDLPFSVTIRQPVNARAGEGELKPTDEQLQRIGKATEMFMRPNNEQPGREFMEMVLEDLICLGGGCIEVRENTSDERPLFLWPVDVQSVRINANWQPGDTQFRYSQGRGYMYSAIGTSDDTTFTDDDMLYMKINARTSSPFGYGYLESAFNTVNAFIGAFEYAQRRSSNATPAFAIFLGENVTIEQVRRWQHYWENEIEGRASIPILGGGRAPQVMSFAGAGQDPLWIDWQLFLIRVIAMSFGLSTLAIGLEQDVNKSTSESMQDNDWISLAPVANAVKQYYTHWILWYRLGWTDLEFQWQVRTSDELKQAEILATQWNSDGIYVDEIRKVYERPALPDGLGQMTKTAYMAAIKAASMPTPAPGVPGDGGDVVTPFDQERDELSPAEAAFVRAAMRDYKQNRYHW